MLQRELRETERSRKGLPILGALPECFAHRCEPLMVKFPEAKAGNWLQGEGIGLFSLTVLGGL